MTLSDDRTFGVRTQAKCTGTIVYTFIIWYNTLSVTRSRAATYYHQTEVSVFGDVNRVNELNLVIDANCVTLSHMNRETGNSCLEGSM